MRQWSFENLTLMSLKGRGKKEEQVSSWAQVCLSCFSEARAYECKCDGFKWLDVFLLQAPRHLSALGQVPCQPRGGTAPGVGVGESRPRGVKSPDLSPPSGEHRGSRGAPGKGESQGTGSREVQPVTPPSPMGVEDSQAQSLGLDLRLPCLGPSLFLSEYLIFFLSKYLASPLAQRLMRLSPMQETQVRSPGIGKIPGDGSGNPLQYSCLENFMDGGSW